MFAVLQRLGADHLPARCGALASWYSRAKTRLAALDDGFDPFADPGERTAFPGSPAPGAGDSCRRRRLRPIALVRVKRAPRLLAVRTAPSRSRTAMRIGSELSRLREQAAMLERGIGQRHLAPRLGAFQGRLDRRRQPPQAPSADSRWRRLHRAHRRVLADQARHDDERNVESAPLANDAQRLAHAEPREVVVAEHDVGSASSSRAGEFLRCFHAIDRKRERRPAQRRSRSVRHRRRNPRPGGCARSVRSPAGRSWGFCLP